MFQGILTYKWTCEDFENGVYKTKKWKLIDKKIVEKIKSPYADLEIGWYVDENKQLCYFYSMKFNTITEVERCLAFAFPPNYPIDSFVKYEYCILEYNDENCNTDKEPKIIREKMTCICKEGTTEDCKDEKTGIRIEKLNTCIPVNSKICHYIKTTSVASPILDKEN